MSVQNSIPIPAHHTGRSKAPAERAKGDERLLSVKKLARRWGVTEKFVAAFGQRASCRGYR